MSRKHILLLSALLLLIGLFGWQNGIQLRAEEPRRAIVSLEMLLTGEYIVPQINGWSYYNKPPVFNWIMVGFYEVFNSYEEWVVRLPSLLSIIVLAFLHFRFARKYVSRQTAILSSFFFVTCGEVLLYGSLNTGEIDPFYALVVYLQVMAIFLYYERENWWKLFLWSYFLVAVGFLTKGLPSLAFQALTLLAMIFYEKKWRWLFSFQHLGGILLMLLLCGAYFYAYGLKEDVVGFLVRQYKEASQRTGLETDSTETLIQSLSFPLMMAKLLLPWSLLTLFFFKKGFLAKIRKNRFLTFSALFILFNIPIYWFSGDFKPRYYYMFLPFLALFLAYFYEENKERMQWAYKTVKIVFGIIAAVLPLGLLGLLFVPALQVVPNLEVRVAITVIISAAVSFLYFRSHYKIVTMILMMGVARVALNLFYMPVWQQDEQVAYYREAVEEMLGITGQEQIFMTGQPYTFTSDASIGPFTFEKVRLTTAPIMAYQIPYYITRHNEKILRFEPELKKGKLFLVPEEMLSPEEHEVLFELYDHPRKRNYYLIRP